jgi:hypothetical protein
MLQYKMYKVYNSSEVFALIQKKYGEDVVGEFNELYCPPQSGAIYFWIPDTDRDFEELTKPERYVAEVLLENGMIRGEACYINANY